MGEGVLLTLPYRLVIWVLKGSWELEAASLCFLFRITSLSSSSLMNSISLSSSLDAVSLLTLVRVVACAFSLPPFLGCLSKCILWSFVYFWFDIVHVLLLLQFLSCFSFGCTFPSLWVTL